MIRPIDAWSIDQITSGQVITSLSSAIKELTENSLDAGATIVDIKVAGHGRDGFSVSDNGHGIDPEDFEFVARKHATSKLTSFEDLARVSTLGFRGEALASLCASADVVITTNASSEGKGHELTFNHSGEVVSSKSVAAPRGTRVEVSNLFHQLPVRRKTFERSSAREFTKTVELIQEYALLSAARVTLEHIQKNRSYSTLRSQGVKLMQRIACIHGAKRTKTLMDIDGGDPENKWSVSGVISQPVFGMGTAAPVCQLLAVNGRPTQQQRLQKAIVEVYKQYNFLEQPFFVLDFHISPELYDINVSPDKRAILLHDEDALISSFRVFLEKKFDTSGHSVPRSQQTVELPPAKKAKQSLLTFSSFAGAGSMIQQGSKRREVVQAGDAEESEAEEVGDDEAEEVEEAEEEVEEPSESPEESHQDTSEVPNFSQEPQLFVDSETTNANENATIETAPETAPETVPETATGTTADAVTADAPVIADATDDIAADTAATAATTDLVPVSEDPLDVVKAELEEMPSCTCGKNCHKSAPSSPSKSKSSSAGSAKSRPPASALRLKTLNTHIHLPVTLDDVESAMEEASKQQEQSSMQKLQKFAIDEEGVEERLNLSLKKDDFDNMEIVGQFNQGFIVVVNRKAKHDDLFVIDQHASDEIFNFERLQASTVLSRQPLVVPHVLELSAAEELTVQAHLDIFEKNGFSITIKPENPPGQQCLLVSVPYSKSTVFDEKDVLELISKLKEDPNQPKLRCSKLRAMYAMRACRSSIMIGMPLKVSAMEKVVRNMGTLNKPWNCPHGRPTLRHITTLS